MADIYCAYCRRRELTDCIRRWCYRRRTASSFAAVVDSESFMGPGWVGPGVLGPGGSTLADLYCAYCRRRGLTACIRRWCYGRRIAPMPTVDVRLARIPDFTFDVNASTLSVNGIRGPGGSTLADIYCAYCRRWGWIDCIRRWCFRAIIGPGIITFDYIGFKNQ